MGTILQLLDDLELGWSDSVDPRRCIFPLLLPPNPAADLPWRGLAHTLGSAGDTTLGSVRQEDTVISCVDAMAVMNKFERAALSEIEMTPTRFAVAEMDMVSVGCVFSGTSAIDLIPPGLGPRLVSRLAKQCKDTVVWGHGGEGPAYPRRRMRAFPVRCEHLFESVRNPN